MNNSSNLIKSIKVLLQNKTSYTFIEEFLESFEKKSDDLKNESISIHCKIKRLIYKFND